MGFGLVEKTLENVKIATNSNRFLVAAFYVDGDGVLRLKRTTGAFPISRFDEAVQLLSDDLQKETALPKVTLQPADLGAMFDPAEAARTRPTIDELHHQLGVSAHQNPIPEMPEGDLGYHPLLEMPEDSEDDE